MAYGYAHDDCGNSAHFFAVSQRVGANIGINVGNVGLLSGCLKDFLATNSVAVDITGAAGPVSGTAVIGGASGSGVQGGLSRGFLLPVGLSLGLDEATVVGTPDLSHKCPCQKQKCAAPAALPPGFPFPPPGLPAPQHGTANPATDNMLRRAGSAAQPPQAGSTVYIHQCTSPIHIALSAYLWNLIHQMDFFPPSSANPAKGCPLSHWECCRFQHNAHHGHDVLSHRNAALSFY